MVDFILTMLSVVQHKVVDALMDDHLRRRHRRRGVEQAAVRTEQILPRDGSSNAETAFGRTTSTPDSAASQVLSLAGMSVVGGPRRQEHLNRSEIAELVARMRGVVVGFSVGEDGATGRSTGLALGAQALTKLSVEQEVQELCADAEVLTAEVLRRRLCGGGGGGGGGGGAGGVAPHKRP